MVTLLMLIIIELLPIVIVMQRRRGRIDIASISLAVPLAHYWFQKTVHDFHVINTRC